MSSNEPPRDECDSTHFWVYCPGCAYAGKIGVPHNYAADVVVCPQCRQVISVKPEDRILWQPAEPTEFLKKRFPHNNWSTIGLDDSPSDGGNVNQMRDESMNIRQPAPLPPHAEANNQAPVWDQVNEGIAALCIVTAVVFVAAIFVAVLAGALSR